MFWIALYVFPVIWVALFFIGILKLYVLQAIQVRSKRTRLTAPSPSSSNISFLPIVLLALVFNVTNTVGFTYADRDAKRKWASGMAASSMLSQFGGVGGSIVGGLRE